MKILELQLTAFGPFSGATLDLSGGSHGLHVVFGPNEAGKSSALRGLQALLYGIPGQTSDAFLHPYDALRIGGRLRHSNGTEITFFRRKGNRNTLLASDETRLDDHALDLFIGGETAEKFEMFWGIDHARLVEGGREILEGRGNLGESLFAAGSGVSHLRTLRRMLDEEASALYVPRGHQRAINQAVGILRELRMAQRDATVSADEWVRRERAVIDATAAGATLSQRAQELVREQSRLERVKRVLPLLAERKGVCDRLEEFAEFVLLSEDFPKRREEGEAALRTAQQHLDRSENDLSDQETLVEKLGRSPALAAEADAVNELHLGLGKHRKAVADRPRLAGQCAEQRALAKHLLAEWRPDLDPEAATALRVFVGRRGRIQKLAGERERLDERLASVRRDGDEAREQQETLKRQASELPPARDPERLIAEINEARRGGNAEADREKTTQSVKRLTALRAAAIEKLRLPAPTAERPEELRVPSTAAIARFEARAKQLEDEVHSARTEGQRLDKAIRELGANIDTLRTKKAVPTEQDLTAVRARRDAAFELLRQQLEKGRDVTAEVRELLGKGKLLDLYPRTVKQADDVADRLRSEAEHVAKLAQYLEVRERLAKEVEAMEAEARRRAESAAELDSDWRGAWKPVLPAPPPILDARAWRTDFEHLLERSETIAEERENLERLDGWIGKQVKNLRASIMTQDPDARPSAGLAATLAQAEKLRQRVERENHTRSEHARRTRETEHAISDAEKAKRAAQAEIDEWQRKWMDATRGLFPGDAAPPDDVLSALETVEKVVRVLEGAAAYDARIAGIDHDAEQFRGEVSALASRLGETVEHETEDAWVETAHERLAAVLQEEERRRQARERLAHLQEKIRQDHEAVQVAEIALATLREEARCGPDGDLAAAEQRSTELRACRREMERIERDILRTGDGASLSELEAEAASVDRDAIDVRLHEIASQVTETENGLGAARDTRAEAQAQLKVLQGPSVASEKAEEIQTTLAKLREDVVRYARLRIASMLLTRRIEDYRRRNQAPLLLRAGALFREMTLRAFERLEADMDDDRPILVGVRPNGKVVPAHGMSEGTRDQLFLALRLAAVEASCATGEPLPFIVDDILVQFDDDRTAATLNVLANVAARTQVILFTHHGNVRVSAEALKAPTQVIVHEL